MNNTPQQSSKLLMVGLPETGKSTFFVALWHVLNSSTATATLRLTRIEGDTDYVENLHEQWQACEPLARTRPLLQEPSPSREIVLHLETVDSSSQVSVVFPDLSGELYEQHWSSRYWQKSYLSLVQSSSGLLVFLLASQQHAPISIAEVASLIAETSGEETPNQEESSYDPELSPSQVKLVDFLQSHLEEWTSEHPVRVAIVVSAWDKVSELEQLGCKISTPDEYICRLAPLLHQFLCANADRLIHRVYGISAQGGDLNTDRERLQKQPLPAERIRVICPQEAQSESHDITLPVRWVLGIGE